ncbi:MAG: geranylgeranyl reductase family protein [Nitrospirae bacterium]|nr:geranylgeranyl reductase family protein [Nitrospirota bacterium]
MMYDLIVIGMGPAGSTAAFEAASRGMNVLGLDKDHFPRYKTCGGGLSPKIEKLLPVGYESFLEQSVSTLRLSYLSKKRDFQFQMPIAFMVMRETFDHWLVQRAVRAGVRLQTGESALQIEERKETIVVHSHCGSYEGRLAIGSDGALGITNRLLNSRLNLKSAPGLEGEFKSLSDTDQSAISIEVGHAPSGYGWIFPKKGLLSIGVAGMRGRVPVKRPYRNYIKSLFTDLPSPMKESGFPIPIFTGRKIKLASKRLLLAGDAGHLVDPFLGEGIYFAMRSGQIAGKFSKRFIDSGAPTCEYQDEIEREFYPEFRGASRLASLVYRFPKTFFDLTLKHPGVIQMYVDVLGGKRPYRNFLSTVLKTAAFKVFQTGG